MHITFDGLCLIWLICCSIMLHHSERRFILWQSWSNADRIQNTPPPYKTKELSMRWQCVQEILLYFVQCCLLSSSSVLSALPPPSCLTSLFEPIPFIMSPTGFPFLCFHSPLHYVFLNNSPTFGSHSLFVPVIFYISVTPLFFVLSAWLCWALGNWVVAVHVPVGPRLRHIVWHPDGA